MVAKWGLWEFLFLICSTHAGYNLVDTRKRLDGDKKWQEQVGDKWVYTNTNNYTKASYLLRIAKHYNLDLRVEARKLKIDY